MICKKCGFSNEDEDKLCRGCGEPLEMGEPQGPAAAESDVGSGEKMGKSKFTPKKIVIMSITSVIALAVLVLAGIMIVRYVNASAYEEQMGLGEKYLQEGKYEESIAAFSRVLKLDEDNIEAKWTWKGVCGRGKGC
jgi:uncharacterized membrane protein YvbJ